MKWKRPLGVALISLPFVGVGVYVVLTAGWLALLVTCFLTGVIGAAVLWGCTLLAD